MNIVKLQLFILLL